jgi:hypothetical protein
MKIAILAWGALIWEPGTLAFVEAQGWARGGPELPLEFSRVSQTRKGALTLVIDPKNGVAIPTYFAVSSYQDLNQAISNLKERECIRSTCIGYVNCRNGRDRSSVFPEAAGTIRERAEKNNFDAVIWTDLPPNFERVVNMKFTVDNAQTYLHNLEKDGAAKARKYIKKAPEEVETPLRQRMRSDPWLDE